MKILDIEQGSEQWHEARRCKITGTKLKHVMGTTLARTQLLAELIAEKGTEQSKIFGGVPHMERGTNEEPHAIELFEKQTGKKVEQVGMCVHDKHDWITLSPDGLIKDSNGKYSEAVEIKSPDSKTLIFYKIANMVSDIKLPPSKSSKLGIPADYFYQVLHYFIVNPDLYLLHFVSYDERFIAKDMKLYITEVTRDDLKDYIAMAEAELLLFREDWLRIENIVMPDNF